ncbi:MAG: hypothetical protein Q8P41_14280 [Pseudomonadota bacterium]|nr:hypothetical protein [Pseudomonadota bacterium]
MSKINEAMFDVRHIERYLQEGMVTQAQYDEYVAGLEDCAENSEQSAIQMVAHDRNRRVIISEDGPQEEDES